MRSAPEIEGRAFGRARAALIFSSLLFAVPTPVSALWGTAASATSWLAWPLGGLWVAAALLERRLTGRAPGSRARFSPGFFLLVDVVFLTLLLGVTGAGQNPFTLLYFVPITLSILLSQGWTLRVAGLSVVGFACLLGVSWIALGEHIHHAHHAHFFKHMLGMAVALAVSGVLVTVFVHRIARALSAQREEIARLVRERQADRVATSLGALSAGAAHELGSPLGTVQLLADDYPHMNDEERVEAARSISAEVQRMKGILHGMDSGVLSAQSLAEEQAWELRLLVAAHVQDPGCEVLCDVEPGVLTSQPRPIVQQILREFVKNARTVQPEGRLQLRLSLEGENLALSVTDRGPGMSPDMQERAVEPFVSSTGGRGLGLFLAHVHARQLGGALLLLPGDGGGTRVELHLPLRAPSLKTETHD